ncbi:hypothetical protein, partial [Salmonella enterica]|uniref:hypothetical protein n=1 Tax=Salmonella enterica TaxID=28901 RepID=UPI00398C78BB
MCALVRQPESGRVVREQHIVRREAYSKRCGSCRPPVITGSGGGLHTLLGAPRRGVSLVETRQQAEEVGKGGGQPREGNGRGYNGAGRETVFRRRRRAEDD